jgi:hypothetical protein
MAVAPLVSVSFPVKPHVKKFLLRQYGSAHRATKTTMLGQLVLGALEKTYEKPEKKLPGHYTYAVLVPQGYVNRIGATLPRNTQQHLGELCTHLFNMALNDHLDNVSWSGGQVYPELRNFLERYGITEDDMKVESLYRAYTRHCKKKENFFPLQK